MAIPTSQSSASSQIGQQMIAGAKEACNSCPSQGKPPGDLAHLVCPSSLKTFAGSFGVAEPASQEMIDRLARSPSPANRAHAVKLQKERDALIGTVQDMYSGKHTNRGPVSHTTRAAASAPATPPPRAIAAAPLRPAAPRTATTPAARSAVAKAPAGAGPLFDNRPENWPEILNAVCAMTNNGRIFPGVPATGMMTGDEIVKHMASANPIHKKAALADLRQWNVLLKARPAIWEEAVKDATPFYDKALAAMGRAVSAPMRLLGLT